MQTHLSSSFTRAWRAIFPVALLLTLFCVRPTYADTLREPTIDRVTISLSFRNLPLKEALQQIEQASLFAFVYNKAQVDDTRLVSLTAANESVANVLYRLFEGTNVQFRQADDNIILSRLEPKRTAPTGTLEGTVQDYETNEALPGATVLIEGTTLGAATTATGQFSIRNVPEGIHTLAFSYIGYQAATVPNVQVKAGTVTRVNYKLVPSDSKLAEVVVRADVVPENTTERILVDEIRNSRTIVTGISNEQITRSIDRDAAEVVRRVSGVSLQNGRFVQIRGLDPRYTLTMLNDMITPSAESDRKTFSYDMLNSSVIDRIIVYKSPAPELPGDFAGGVVKVYTKSVANARQLQLQLSAQYRPQSSYETHYTYDGGKYDLLGFDDGARSLPEGLPADRSAYDFRGIVNPLSTAPAATALNAEIARKFPNNWNLQTRYQNFDKRAVLNYYDAWYLGKTRLNSLTSLTYTLTGAFVRANRQFFPAQYRLNQDTGEFQEFIPPGQSNIDSIYTESARISVMQNFRWSLSDRHSIEFRNFFNQLGEDETLVREGRDAADGAGDQYYQNVVRRLQYSFRSRSLYNGLLSGEHQLDKNEKTKLSWRVGYARTAEQIPDQRRVGITRRDTLDGISSLLHPDALSATTGFTPNLPGYYTWEGAALQSFNQRNIRFYSSLRESAYMASADVERKLGSLTLKFGWFSDYRKRSFSIRSFTYFLQGNGELGNDLAPYFGIAANGVYTGNDDINNIYNPRNFRPDGSGWDFAENSGLRADSQRGSTRYNASNEQHAGYFALNIPLLDERLNIYGGVRGEWNLLQASNDTTSQTLDLTGPNERDTTIIRRPVQRKLYWLPSVNVSYRLLPQLQIRASYGITLNRPEFREISPVTYYDAVQEAYVSGRLEVTNAEIQNYDLRIEWYPKEDELIAIGGFYKDLKNPIEAVSTAGSGFTRNAISPFNTKSAKVFGAELEIRKRLDFIPLPIFRYLSVVGNATWLKSSVELSDTIREINTQEFAERPLQGSSPYTINGGLYYDNTNSGTQISALYNVIGQRLVLATNSFANFALYEQPRHVIDLSITQRITRFLQVKAGVQDLLNQPFSFFRDATPDETYNSDVRALNSSFGTDAIGDFEELRFRPGSYYTLGFSFTF